MNRIKFASLGMDTGALID
uniref:Uncharacterized protein n=1 Tax=Anguilla anguilla TaxID=7936 RepID=A0A0E9TM62_ANGAN